MRTTIFIFLAMVFICNMIAQESDSSNEALDRIEDFTEDFNNSSDSKPLVSFDDFKELVAKVEKHREERMIDLATFVKMS